MAYRSPRGTRDVLPPEIPHWERLEEVARELARLHGYREIRPPLLEVTELFVRSVGEVTDIVQKEMFTVLKGDHSFTLRPEGTAGIARAYLQADYHKRAPVQKLFNLGPMFRYERPQKGRERQFSQFDIEALGSADPRLDAEVIHIAARFFEELGVEVAVRLNSMGDGEDRERWREAVADFLRPRMEERCDLCRERFERNVLRVLDCKNARCQELNRDVPRLLDSLSEGNREHFDAVIGHLADVGRSAEIDTGIIRGLDYYTHTVFEVFSPRLGRALCGGGRYDHLLRDLGGPDLGAVGFAVGFTPTLTVLEELGLLADLLPRPTDVFVVGAGPELRGEVLAIAEELRRGGVSAVYDVEGRSLKSQMKQAGGGSFHLAVIVGLDELAAGTAQVKHLARTELVTAPRGALLEEVRRRLGEAEDPAR